jgi:hypothetical protein
VLKVKPLGLRLYGAGVKKIAVMFTKFFQNPVLLFLRPHRKVQ